MEVLLGQVGEPGAGPGEAGPDGPDGYVEGGGGLLVAEPGPRDQAEHLALVPRAAPRSGAAPRASAPRSRAGRSPARRGRARRPGRQARHRPEVAAPRPAGVAADVGRDAVQPGQRRAVVQLHPPPVPPDLEEHRRGGVLGLGPVGEVAEAVVVDPVAVAVEQRRQRARVVLVQPVDELPLVTWPWPPLLLASHPYMSGPSGRVPYCFPMSTGLREGDRVALLVSPSPAYLDVVIGLLAAGRRPDPAGPAAHDVRAGADPGRPLPHPARSRPPSSSRSCGRRTRTTGGCPAPGRCTARAAPPGRRRACGAGCCPTRTPPRSWPRSGRSGASRTAT